MEQDDKKGGVIKFVVLVWSAGLLTAVMQDGWKRWTLHMSLLFLAEL